MLRMLKSLFGPAPSSPKYAVAADFLRVFSTLFIAWFHIWQQSWLNPAFTVGGVTVNLRNQVATGYLLVDLMLLISGFLLYLPYADRRECGLKEFYLRRAARILPSYWFCLAVMLFVFALPQGQYYNAEALWRDLLSHLTFTHNFAYDTYVATKLNVVLWTLAVEVQFYLIFPLVGRAFRRQPAVCFCGMLAVVSMYRYFHVDALADTTIWVNRLPNMLEVYACGMLAAHIYVQLARRKTQAAWDAWLCTALAVAAFLLIWRLMWDQGWISGYEEIRRGQMDRRFLISLAGGVFLVCGSRAVGLFRRLMSNRPVRFLSAVSFNFYIWHQTLAVKLKEWHIPAYVNESPHMAGEQPWQLRYTLLCFFGALALAVALTYLLEKPCAKLILRLSDSGKKASGRDT